jgi:antitoxin (DNA-binding transcriptional repressor) of toxin-antitoxin stability system
MPSVNLAEAKAGLSALLAAVAAGEEVVITRLRRSHAHQPGPAGSAVELLRELRDQEP